MENIANYYKYSAPDPKPILNKIYSRFFSNDNSNLVNIANYYYINIASEPKIINLENDKL
jgi:hypothetical protein